ncbi:hypothetical protein ACH4UY_33380 [Streptomyces longwoodensis]|uniref:hypothetical protein n=1 Tax=Streptomyces longwoodensis TaxID=68231 RepID=UPI0037A77FE8
MPAISVGSVEVDVIPNAQGIYASLRRQLVPAAGRVGDEMGRVMGRYVARHIAAGVVQGIQTGGRAGQAGAVRQGSQTGSAFARSFKGRLEAALRDLPEVRLHANSSQADREIYHIRTQLQALRDVRIGIDVDAGTATAAMARLQERLERLSASNANVQVRIDTAAAAAQLAAMQAQVNRLDGDTADVDVDVDTRPAVAGFSALTTAAAAFGPTILPVLPVVAAGLGAIAAAGVAAAAGVGGVALVAVPAFKQIGSVLQAQKSAQDAATSATMRGGQAAAQASSRALQLAGAQASLATAERNGARQIAQAQQQVSQARRAAAQAAAQASQRAQQAARAVQDAEGALSAAQRDATRAQQGLTDARRQAARELEDLNNRLTDSVLSQRDAELRLTEARKHRDEVMASNASDLEKQRAQLDYDQAVQSLKEQTTETKRLKQEATAANKAGVTGSQTYRTAQEQLAQAQQQVADRTRALQDAQAEQRRTEVQNAQDLAEAQQRVADAQRNVADVQVQAAEQVASAQRSLQQASMSSAGGVDQAAIAQAKYRAELAKLSPAARATMNAYTGLRTAFSAWSRSLQPQVMPIFTRALVGMKRVLPGISPLVRGAADAIGGLMDRASASFKRPFWQTFKDDLDGSVKPAVTGLGVAFGNVFKGMAGVIGAFLPHMDGISQSMQGVTKRFADWGANLRGSAGFERFLSYASEQAPKVGHLLAQLAGSALNIAKALAPVSGVVMKVLGTVAEAVGLVAQKMPWLVRGVWAAIVVWGVLNAVMSANPFSLIVIGVAALVAALVYAYNKFDWFRTIVQAIGNSFVWLWQQIIKPYVEFMIAYWKAVGNIALWLWREAISPVVNLIIGAFKLWWAGVKLYFGLVRSAVTALGGHFMWLYKTMVKPVWNAISDAIGAVWRVGIKPVFDAVRAAVGKVATAFSTARDNIGKQWSKLEGIAKKPIAFVINTIYNKGIVGVWNAIASAFGADPLDEFHPAGFARGGVLPGYTPGRDVHRFLSPTGGALELSGGEAIMRPEWTRAVGAGFVGTMNRIARSQGSQGIRAAMAPILGGNPHTPTDHTLRYADGGIFGWIGSAANKVAGAGSAAWNKIKEATGWLTDGLQASAKAGIKHTVQPLLKNFPGMDTRFGKAIRRMPTKLIDAMFGYAKAADDKGGGGLGGPKIAAALRWAKAQAGKPYIWGGVGPAGFDCSGFMGAIENVLRGLKPNSRRWATGAFSGKTAPPGWVYHGNSPFRIGITNAGVGHTAGTLGRTDVESRGGDGVVVGPRARGFNSSLFTDWYGFKPGSFDSGGYLQPGLNLAYNGTGRPEPVFTTRQANALSAMAGRTAAPQPVVVELHAKEGALGDFIDVRIQDHDQALVQVINAN